MNRRKCDGFPFTNARDVATTASLEKNPEEEDAVAAHDSEIEVEEDDENDVLLIEAGHVLIDMLLLSLIGIKE